MRPTTRTRAETGTSSCRHRLDGDVTNLHAFWDVTTVKALGHSAAQIANKLDGKITRADIKAWSAGGPKDWAMQSFAIGKRDAYNLPTRPTCARAGAVALSPAYQTTAEADAAHQLSVAGVRLAKALEQALPRRRWAVSGPVAECRLVDQVQRRKIDPWRSPAFICNVSPC